MSTLLSIDAGPSADSLQALGITVSPKFDDLIVRVLPCSLRSLIAIGTLKN
jgi:hypothetical protein